MNVVDETLVAFSNWRGGGKPCYSVALLLHHFALCGVRCWKSVL